MSGLWNRFAPSRRRRNPHFQLQTLEGRLVPTAYLATDLVSDQPGVARVLDPNLINAWGISLSPTIGAFWVSSEGTDRSMLYTGDVNGSNLIKVPLEVSIPGGEPTGQVFNATSDFVVTNGTVSLAALFIFASTSGQVTGWHPAVAPITTAKPGFMATDGASYTGMALANNGAGNFLYLADFENGKIDVLDGQFDLTELAGDFVDPHLPDNFAPFNVAAINGKLYVAFAQQNASGEEVTGRGRGFVSVFDLNGNFLERLVNRGRLDAPWAMVQAPSDFGEFSGDLLVGNFGDGRINAYDPETGKFQGALTFRNGKPLVIDGLWGLAFGNGVTSGDKNTLYYAAGPDNETHGLFGKITANPDGTNPVKAAVVGSDLVITGSRIDDDVFVRLTSSGNNVAVFSSNQSIGTFPIAGLSTIQFNGFAGNDSIAVSSNVELTTVLDGGAGNDFVIGGGGNNILLGGPGSDFVSGRGDRDILIGGDGRDILSGFSGDDILIGGRTAHDGNTGALLGILGVWTNADSYEDRVAAIRAGMPKLDSTTVFDDAAFDLMLGLGGRDWYWSFAPDLILGLQGDETVN